MWDLMRNDPHDRVCPANINPEAIVLDSITNVPGGANGRKKITIRIQATNGNNGVPGRLRADLIAVLKKPSSDTRKEGDTVQYRNLDDTQFDAHMKFWTSL